MIKFVAILLIISCTKDVELQIGPRTYKVIDVPCGNGASIYTIDAGDIWINLSTKKIVGVHSCGLNDWKNNDSEHITLTVTKYEAGRITGTFEGTKYKGTINEKGLWLR